MILAGLAALGSLAFLLNLPSVVSRFSDEPEDTYLSVAWIMALTGLLGVWGIAGFRLSQGQSLGRLLSVATGIACAAAAGTLVSIFRGVI